MRRILLLFLLFVPQSAVAAPISLLLQANSALFAWVTYDEPMLMSRVTVDLPSSSLFLTKLYWGEELVGGGMHSAAEPLAFDSALVECCQEIGRLEIMLPGLEVRRYEFHPQPVPEPATLTLLGVGLLGLTHRLRASRRT